MSRWLLPALLLSAMGAPLWAQPAAPVTTLLRGVVTAEPLEIARSAAAIGDDAVLDGLRMEQPTPNRFAAALASPWMEDPEAAIERLSTLAGSRDPDLAPAAAWALWRCAQKIAIRDPNSERPGLPTGVLDQLRERASDTSLRPDIARLAWLSHALLAGPADGSSD